MAKWASKELWTKLSKKDRDNLQWVPVSEVVYFLKNGKVAIFCCSDDFNGSVWDNTPIYGKFAEFLTDSVNQGLGLEMQLFEKAPFFRVRRSDKPQTWTKTEKGFSTGASEYASEDEFFC